MRHGCYEGFAHRFDARANDARDGLHRLSLSAKPFIEEARTRVNWQ